jgi:hypothetical protein
MMVFPDGAAKRLPPTQIVRNLRPPLCSAIAAPPAGARDPHRPRDAHGWQIGRIGRRANEIQPQSDAPTAFDGQTDHFYQKKTKKSARTSPTIS